MHHPGTAIQGLFVQSIPFWKIFKCLKFTKNFVCCIKQWCRHTGPLINPCLLTFLNFTLIYIYWKAIILTRVRAFKRLFANGAYATLPFCLQYCCCLGKLHTECQLNERYRSLVQAEALGTYRIPAGIYYVSTSPYESRPWAIVDHLPRSLIVTAFVALRGSTFHSLCT